MSRETTRLDGVTEKIPKSATGLAGSLFVHVMFEPDGSVHEVSFSEKGKDHSTLDNILIALGESVTKIITDRQRSVALKLVTKGK